MIRSVWQQKGQLLGQLLSKTHRRLPMADARSAAKQAVTASVRKRMRFVKSRTQHFGSGGGVSPTSAVPVGSVPVPEPPRPIDRRQAVGDDGARYDARFTESPSGSMRRSASLDSLDVVLHAPPTNGEFARGPDGEPLPFDIGAADLIYPEKADREGSYPRAGGSRGSRETSASASSSRPSFGLGSGALVEEPQRMGVDEERALHMDDSGVEWPSMSSSSTDHVRPPIQLPSRFSLPCQPPDACPPPSKQTSPSLSRPSMGSRTSSSHPSTASRLTRDSASSIAADVDVSFASMGSLGRVLSDQSSGTFPRHRPVRRAGSGLNDDEKKRLLLGKAMD